MKKKRNLLVLIIFLSTVVPLIFPYQVILAQGLGEFDGLQNGGFEEYDSSGNLLYWSGSGSRCDTEGLEGQHSYSTLGSRDLTYYLKQSVGCYTQILGQQVTFMFWFKGQYEYSRYDGGYNYYESAKAEFKYTYKVYVPTPPPTPKPPPKPPITIDSVNPVDPTTNSYVAKKTPTTKGYYVTKSKTVSGDWVQPTSTEWYQASVTFTVPSYINSLEVRIVGRDQRSGGSFKTKVDNAALDITRGPYISSCNYGQLGYSLALDSANKIVADELDGVVPATASMTAFADPGYYIMSTKITIYLEPVLQRSQPWPFPPVHYSGQYGEIATKRWAQGNNHNFYANPEAVEASMNAGIWATGQICDDLVGAGLGAAVAGPVGAAGVFVGFLTLKLLGINSEDLLHMCIDTDLHDPDADAYLTDTDYFAYEKWVYPQVATIHEDAPVSSLASRFVSTSNAMVYFHWNFNRASASSFKIGITYEVEFGEPYYHSYDYPCGEKFKLASRYTIVETIYQTIYM